MQHSGHCSNVTADGLKERRIKVQAEGIDGPTRAQAAHKQVISGCAQTWGWDVWTKSSEIRLYGHATAQFHPNWSNGTAAVRANKVLNYGIHYWEIQVSQRVFGTSMMFGVCTNRARMHADAFVNMLGEDEHSWGLSHKGMIWHNGKCKPFTRPFRENEPTTVGILLDWHRGTLSYYKDGESLGIAFYGLNIQDDLFPVCASTAAKTEMTISRCIRTFDNLQDRCRAVIAQYCHNNGIDDLPLPTRIRDYIKEVLYGQWES